jgi:hypothetical protein
MELAEIKKIIKNITFEKSNLDMGWKWQVKENSDGFMIRTSFKRPDINNGKVGTGFGRWMFVDKNSSETGVVMTAWLCAELVVRHELMEAFLYKKVRILNPHKTVEELAFPKELGTNFPRMLWDIEGNAI